MLLSIAVLVWDKVSSPGFEVKSSVPADTLPLRNYEDRKKELPLTLEQLLTIGNAIGAMA